MRSLYFITLAFAIVGCNSPVGSPDRAPDMTGTVLRVDLSKSPTVSVNVESANYHNGEVKLHIIGADIYERRQGRLIHSETSRLERGALVKVWISGGELRSLPPQYGATRIEIVGFSDLR